MCGDNYTEQENQSSKMERAHTRGPPGDHNGEDPGPDGDQRDGNEHGRRNGTHDIGPHSRAVHEALENAEVLLEQRAVLVGQHDLEVTLLQHNHNEPQIFSLIIFIKMPLGECLQSR